ARGARLLIPGGAEGPGAHPDPDERRPHRRAYQQGGRSLRQGRLGARRNRRQEERGDLIMRALAKLERAPGLTLTEVKKPDVGHNDVLIRIKKTAICGTDCHIWKWDEWAQNTIPVPMQDGHEYVALKDDVWTEVRGFEIGDRVSGEGHITCGHCRNCRA